MTIEQLYVLFTQSTGVTTDTRKITENSLYFALKGSNFDGNTFASEAIKQGASYAVIDNKKHKTSEQHIVVDDVLSTLQALAKHHRSVLNIPIIGLTGSNGKTTTKELIKCVLEKKYQVTATLGNLNNHIGVPLTLLSMDKNTEIGIVEMGANHLKEIELLTSIAQPNFGYITNFGKAHLEGFGSEAGIIKGKSELYTFLRESHGQAFINTDDPIQVTQSSGLTNITFSSKTISFITADPFVKSAFKGVEIPSQLIGKYNYLNIAAAICMGDYFKVALNDIKEAIVQYTPTNNRSQIIKKENVTLLLDAYNANPSSMEAALENFDQLSATKKIVVLGDMFELGKTSPKEHQHIADIAEKMSFDKIVLIGEAFQKVLSKKANQFASYETFIDDFDTSEYNDAIVLIKGSRGMALERLVKVL
ncbi:MAG: UDP-N-acetylmuramoyl-tripeptide--D-alanyl-D-alanine ligase [Flavobacteriaceae bacterium]|nr:MAG: UDP-N-acetylmuramoyl-tripeptide--D-alanyl-D-alanine ligase [Flavobacteriaceae bacterium]